MSWGRALGGEEEGRGRRVDDIQSLPPYPNVVKMRDGGNGFQRGANGGPKTGAFASSSLPVPPIPLALSFHRFLRLTIHSASIVLAPGAALHC